MEMRLLGTSGIYVSALSFGTLTFGGRDDHATRIGSTDIEEAKRMLGLCLDAGINLIDTANVYSQGRAEEVLGAAMGTDRQRIVLATKVFGGMGSGLNDRGLSRSHIVRACEESLRRLRTDYIDLYQAHGFDALTPMEETLAAFEDLIRAGKVRAIGCSNYSGWHLMKALAVADRDRRPRYVSQQTYYSLVGRDLEFELVPLALDQGVGILVWGPLAQGFLTGKFRADAPPEPGRYAHNAEPPIYLPDAQKYAIVDALIGIARERGVSVSQVAMNWVLRKPGITSVIFGARTVEQLEDNLKAAAWRLSDEEMAGLDEVSTPPVPYPYWHQRKYGIARNPWPPSVRAD